MIRALIKLSIRVVTKPARMVMAMLGGGDPEPEANPAWSAAPPPKPPTTPRGPSPFEVQVDPGNILSRMADGEAFVFIDVRQTEELAASGMIEHALHIPSQDLPRRVDDLDKAAEIILYCAAGVRSLDAAMFLREKGFETVWSLGGGLPHWQADGGDVVPLD